MRCARLNIDGVRCRAKALYHVTMHQDEQTYGMKPEWCVVPVCGKHAEGTRYFLSEKADKPTHDTFKIKKEEGR